MTLHPLKKLNKKWLRIRDKAHDSLQALLARQQDLVIKRALVERPAAQRKARLVLMAHFSAQNTVHPYVVRYIQALQEADCDVMLISTSANLPDHVIASLNAMGVSVLIRRNIGYDFGSWRIAIDVYPEMVNDYPTLIFANDSVYGPLFDLAPVLAALDDSGFDVWSLTASNERGRHLQTYFWGMSGKSVESGCFDYFWHQYYRFYSRRQTVIDRYELQIAHIAEQQFGLKTGACWSEAMLLSRYPHAVSEQAKRINPLRDYWRELIGDFGFPFVKRELFKGISPSSERFGELAAAINTIDPEVWKLADDHLLQSSSKSPV